ncbi:MAG TPA: nuclease A inhibitor family protein [Polyangia bacterium]|jgi:hypothetical protein|nr:nuclease A inhibitor family protein [Polyangia bacterium]
MLKRSWTVAPSVGAVLFGLTTDAMAATAPARVTHASMALRDELVRDLERLTEGLLFMSESDFPLAVVLWRQPGGNPNARRLAALTGEPHPDLAQVMTVDEFFANAATPRPWHDAEEQTIVRRYAGVVHFLKTRLTGVRVFRFGRITIHAYVVGTTRNGDWIGLATTQIET